MKGSSKTPEAPRIFLATPCYGGLAHALYMRSLVALRPACLARGIGLHVELGGGDALIGRARAAMMAKFLASGASHLLFIDADVGFSPEAVFRLLDSGHDVVGGFYPAKSQSSPGALVQEYEPLSPPADPTPDGFARVAALAAGFLMISREAAQRLTDKYPDLRAGLGDVHQASAATAAMVFESFIDPPSGRYLSDYQAFCARWRMLGGEIWADMESRLAHVGAVVHQSEPAGRALPEPTFQQALALHRSGDVAGAERAYRTILSGDEHADVLCNLGLILKDRGEYAQAEAFLKRAAAAAPDSHLHPYNLGNLYQQTRRLEEAVPCFQRAIRLGAGRPCKLNLGNTLLALGRYSEGWPMYDERPEHANSQAHKLGFPEWRGEPLAGKRLFIWPEQGFGDQILAARFIPLLEAAEVTFVCAPELVDLFAQLPANAIARKGDISVPPHDYWSIPLCLPRWIAKTPRAPYLKARPKPSAGRIGVAWKGNSLPDPLRSLTPEAAERLRALPGAVSLHPEDTGARTFQETAEIIAGLDLVVTIDTSIAHLAGALGKPTIVLLHHYSSDWRWREANDGTAFWYPSARVLRQPRPGDWTSVVTAVGAQLVK